MEHGTISPVISGQIIMMVVTTMAARSIKPNTCNIFNLQLSTSATELIAHLYPLKNPPAKTHFSSRHYVLYGGLNCCPVIPNSELSLLWRNKFWMLSDSSTWSSHPFNTFCYGCLHLEFCVSCPISVWSLHLEYSSVEVQHQLWMFSYFEHYCVW